MREFDIEAFTSDVEKNNGIPIILSRYGFKKIEFNGKKYLLALTKADAIELTAETDGISMLEAEQKVDSRVGCAGSIGSCVPLDGCRVCRPVSYGGAGWKCDCVGV